MWLCFHAQAGIMGFPLSILTDALQCLTILVYHDLS